MNAGNTCGDLGIDVMRLIEERHGQSDARRKKCWSIEADRLSEREMEWALVRVCGWKTCFK